MFVKFRVGVWRMMRLLFQLANHLSRRTSTEFSSDAEWSGEPPRPDGPHPVGQVQSAKAGRAPLARGARLPKPPDCQHPGDSRPTTRRRSILIDRFVFDLPPERDFFIYSENRYFTKPCKSIFDLPLKLILTIDVDIDIHDEASYQT